jgi:hypothetical protein
MSRSEIDLSANSRSGGPRRLVALLGRALGPAARRRGFAEASLLADWPGIVGPELASRASPARLAFPAGRTGGAVLHLHVSSAAALELQHREPQILERINGYFGHVVVARLRLVHAPIARRAVEAPRPAPAEGIPAAVRERVLSITDPALREALATLGHAIALDRPPRRGHPA